MTQNTTTTYRVELANKVRNGRAVGNLWGVGRYVDGRRRGWALSPQENEGGARAFAADMTALARALNRLEWRDAPRVTYLDSVKPAPPSNAALHVEQEADVRAAREDEQLRKGGV